MSAPNDDYKGNPSTKFLEEKLLLSEMLKRNKEVEEALPLIKKVFERIEEHSEMLDGYRSMFKLIHNNSEDINERIDEIKANLASKISESNLRMRSQVTHFLDSMVTKESFEREISKRAQQKSFDTLAKRVGGLSEIVEKELKNMIQAKFRELQISLDSKANTVQFELLDHAKVSIEDFESLEHRIEKVEQFMSEEKKNKESEVNFSRLFQANSDDNNKEDDIPIISELKEKIKSTESICDNIKEEVLLQRDMISEQNSRVEDLKIRFGKFPVNQYESILQKTIDELHGEDKKALQSFREEINHIKNWVEKSKEEEIRSTLKNHTKRLIPLESFMGESKNILKLLHKQRHSIEAKSKENHILFKDIMFKFESISNQFQNTTKVDKEKEYLKKSLIQLTKEKQRALQD